MVNTQGSELQLLAWWLGTVARGTVPLAAPSRDLRRGELLPGRPGTVLLSPGAQGSLVHGHLSSFSAPSLVN